MDDSAELRAAEQEAAATGELMKAALLLVAQTERGDRRFPTDNQELKRLVDAIRPWLVPDIDVTDADQPVAHDRVRLWVAPNGDGSIRLEVIEGPNSSQIMNLWADGEVFGEAATMSLEAEPEEPSASTERTGPPPFRGERQLRTLQIPEADRNHRGLTFQAVELYSDGAKVKYTTTRDAYFDADRAFERFLSTLRPQALDEAPEAMAKARVNLDLLATFAVWLEDDLGTSYARVGARGSGVDRVDWTMAFVPAVPESVRRLDLCTHFARIGIDLP